MIEVKEARPGDCVYAKVPFQNAPLFGEIIRVLENQNAVEVTTKNWGWRIIWYKNAFWEEKEAKKHKYQAPEIKKESLNIIKEDKKELGDIDNDIQQKDSSRKRKLHNRKSKSGKGKGAKKSN